MHTGSGQRLKAPLLQSRHKARCSVRGTDPSSLTLLTLPLGSRLNSTRTTSVEGISSSMRWLTSGSTRDNSLGCTDAELKAATGVTATTPGAGMLIDAVPLVCSAGTGAATAGLRNCGL